MKIAVFGARGKVGSIMAAGLAEAGHEVVPIDLGDPVELGGCDAAVDFTQPDAVEDNVAACVRAKLPCVIGTTGFDRAAVDRLAQEHNVRVFHAPNFAIGAVLMMAAAVLLLLVLTWGGARFAWTSPQIIGLLAASGLLWLAFTYRLTHTAEPSCAVRWCGRSRGRSPVTARSVRQCEARLRAVASGTRAPEILSASASNGVDSGLRGAGVSSAR